MPVCAVLATVLVCCSEAKQNPAMYFYTRGTMPVGGNLQAQRQSFGLFDDRNLNCDMIVIARQDFHGLNTGSKSPPLTSVKSFLESFLFLSIVRGNERMDFKSQGASLDLLAFRLLVCPVHRCFPWYFVDDRYGRGGLFHPRQGCPCSRLGVHIRGLGHYDDGLAQQHR